jgi:hypothetical protein
MPLRQANSDSLDMKELTGTRAMKVTTVRFGADLWALLEREAALAGVSVSQYVREAALARAAFSAGTRAGAPSELLASWSQATLSSSSQAEQEGSTERLIAALTRSQSRRQRDDAAALRAESRQARRKAGEIRSTSPRPKSSAS